MMESEEDPDKAEQASLSSQFGQKARDTRQLRYLSQSVRLEEAVAPRVVRLSILLIALAVIAFIGWASITKVEEIKRVQGEIIPQGYLQTVQHLEGGIVKAIHIKEGALVEKGDLLVSLDSVDTIKDLERVKLKMRSLRMQKIRLSAQVTGEEPDYSAYIGDFGEEVANQLNMYHASVEAEERERLVLLDQIAQRKNAIDTLETRIETTLTNLKIVQKLYNRRKILMQDGVISEVRFLETEQRLNDLKGEVENLSNQIIAAEFALNEFQARLNSLDAKNTDEDLQELESVEEEIKQTQEELRKLETKTKMLDVRAPTRGFVKGFTINTIGAVIQPGELIAEIVPIDKELISMVRIEPESIGYVSVGDRVKLKVSTYDFSRYGTVSGQLEFISATTFLNEAGDPYYNGRVILDKNYVGDDPANVVLPGMTVIADIIIGRKTIMQYLLKPIHQSLKTAFTER